MKRIIIAVIPSLFVLAGCKTKNEVRREQDVERLKQELSQVKGDRTDLDNISEELKVEIARMNNIVEERATQNRQALDDIKRDISQMSTKMQQLEGRIEAQEAAEKESRSRAQQAPPPQERVKPSYEVGKRFYDEGRYEEAVDILKAIKGKGRNDENKKVQYLLAEAYFSNKEFASAALEYSDYKRLYPKDSLVPQAIYRQANAFKSMGKNKEAKLFYQELMERYPKSNLVAKAKQEMRRLK